MQAVKAEHPSSVATVAVEPMGQAPYAAGRSACPLTGPDTASGVALVTKPKTDRAGKGEQDRARALEVESAPSSAVDGPSPVTEPP